MGFDTLLDTPLAHLPPPPTTHHPHQVAKFPPSVVSAAKRKLSELEDLGGVSGGGEGGRKTRRALSAEEQAEGLDLVRTFLKEFSSLPLHTLSEADASAALAKLQHGMRASTNPLVAAVCEEAM